MVDVRERPRCYVFLYRSRSALFHRFFDSVLAEPDPALVSLPATQRKSGGSDPGNWGGLYGTDLD